MWTFFSSGYALAQRGTGTACRTPECQEIVRNISGNNSLVFLAEIFLFIVISLGIAIYIQQRGKKSDKNDDN